MNKSKLQELCTKKRWKAPIYTSTREGFDHCPRFKATVVVNGESFQGLNFSKTCKEAQNEAARIAYDHFAFLPSSPVPVHQSLPPASTSSVSQTPFSNISPYSQGSSNASNELNYDPIGERILSENNREILQNLALDRNGSGVKDDNLGDVSYLHKCQLQNYTRKKGLKLPVYCYAREGPSHASRFKATVTVNGRTFECPEFHRTVKEAEYAAAKAALSSLWDGDQKEDCSFYKGLLQRLTQKEGLSTPVYNTIKSGESHMPTFASTVEVGGDVFHGIEAKNKKEAELNAAKIAYSSLDHRKSSRVSELLSHSSQAQEAPKCITSSSVCSLTVGPQLKLKPTDILVSTSSIRPEEKKDGDQEAANEIITHTGKASADHSVDSSPKPTTLEEMKSSSSSEVTYARLRDPFSSGASSPKDVPASPTRVLQSSNHLANRDFSAAESSFLCNRVRVYPCKPNRTFPEGITLMPISDEHWVAVSLDFPNRQGN